MLIILSPAKTLDFESKSPIDNGTNAEFTKQAQYLINILKTLSVSDLESIMKINNKLALLNYNRFKTWQKKPLDKQAICVFKGEVYNGLSVNDWSYNNFMFAQQHLRILSGLYGVLRPLDFISPFRLEMGTKLEIDEHKNLYGFWGNTINKYIMQYIDTQGYKTLLNLASNEYFKATKPRLLNTKVITPVFKDFRKGDYKVVTMYAKKARGLMTRFVIKNELSNIQDIKYFDAEGYIYNDRFSTDTQWVFTRDKKNIRYKNI